MKNKAFFSALILFVFLTTAAWTAGKQEESDSFTVITTTNIITDVVRNIAGDAVEITGLIDKGDNPHNYDPTPREMAIVESADLIFVNGFDLEENLLKSISNVTTGKIVEVSSTVDYISFGEEDHHEDEEHHDDEEEEHHDDDQHEDEHNHDIDPHTWMSPLNVIDWTDVISSTLIEMDPENSDIYRKNAESYKAKLREIDSEARELFSSIPHEQKVVISDHKIFGYFSRDYGFTSLGALIPNFSTNAETSARDLAELIEEVNEHGIKTVFLGNTSGGAIEKLAEVLKSEADHPMEILTILTGSLTEEGEGSDYLSFIRFNINQIAKGLSD